MQFREKCNEIMVWGMGLRPLDSDPTVRGQYYKDPPQWPQAMLERDWVELLGRNT